MLVCCVLLCVMWFGDGECDTEWLDIGNHREPNFTTFEPSAGTVCETIATIQSSSSIGRSSQLSGQFV